MCFSTQPLQITFCFVFEIEKASVGTLLHVFACNVYLTCLNSLEIGRHEFLSV